MKLKSYFAGTVEAAMALAAKELGDDTMLVYSRESAPEARYLGRYEVVFALPEPEEPEPEAKPALTAPALPAAPAPVPPPPVASAAAPEPPPASPLPDPLESIGPALGQILEQIALLRTKVDRLSATANRPAFTASIPTVRQRLSVEECQWIVDRLIAADLTPSLVTDLLEAVDRRRIDHQEETLRTSLHKLLASRITIDSRVGRDAGGAPIVLLMGPPGGGKTTSLVKIAARYALETRRTPHLISFDNFRIGGSDQLRTFASILGATFQPSETSAGLKEAIQDSGPKDLVLVDTAGYGEKDLDTAAEVLEFLDNFPQAEVHLTLSASMKPADLTRAVERFERFRPAKLLFTRLDETQSFGPIWSEASRLKIPLSYFSDGQQIPEDLRPADTAWLIDRIVGNLMEEVTSTRGAGLDGKSNARSERDRSEVATAGTLAAPWLSGAFLPYQKPAWAGVSAAG